VSIQIPRSYGYASASPFMMSAGSTARSPLSGDATRTNRLGDRFGLTVQYPPLSSDLSAMKLIALLNQGLSDGIIMHWPQVGFTPAAMGAPVVNGGNQLGSTLAIAGVSGGPVLRHGQFGNFTAGGKLHLFHLTSDVTIAGSTAPLPIFPMIRKSPATGSSVAFANPQIEGFIEGDGREWTVDRARSVGITLTVVEK
jgi:hypothetical protein